jgi:23S rRNA pseudouridine1911/1915/1917 synthase
MDELHPTPNSENNIMTTSFDKKWPSRKTNLEKDLEKTVDEKSTQASPQNCQTSPQREESAEFYPVLPEMEPGWDCMVVEPDHVGMRLDAFMAKMRPLHSRTRWQEWIRGGHHIRIGDVPISALNHRMTLHAVCLVAPLPEPTACDLTPCPMALTVYYEDKDLLVIEKPFGLVVHPGNGTREPTLIHGLLAQCRDLSGIGGVQKPGLVHRLDKDTSGLMIVAKHDAAHQGLSQQFAQRTLEKKYLAFVWGQPSPPFGRIETLLGRNPHKRTQQAVVPTGGKEAITTYRTVRTNGTMSVLECGLLTGRTHQIRVHCAHLKHPVIGDSLYGNGRGHPRQALHAHRLRFEHPCSGQEIDLTSPLPQDLQELWDRMGEGNS